MFNDYQDNAPDRASKGGEVHKLSDKIYKGGQFMPAPHNFPKAKRQANFFAANFRFASPYADETPFAGHYAVRATVDGRRKLVKCFKTLDEAKACVAELIRIKNAA